jgi:hypothetical protein
VFQIELEVWNFHPFDMLTPYLKMEEVVEFQRGITAKRKLGSAKSGIVFE